MNYTNNTAGDVDLSSIYQIPSKCTTPLLINKSNFKKLSIFSPNSVSKTKLNTEKKKDKSVKKELFILENDENIEKRAFFEENHDYLSNKFKKKKNIPTLKSTFSIKEINTSTTKKESSSKNNNCIFTENKIFYNPILLKNQDGSSQIKFRENLERKEDGHVKKSSFKLKKFNFFKVFKKSQKYYLKDLKTIHKKIKKVRKKRRKKYITCHCKTTECLKRYCECKKQNGFCNRTCKCLDCKNTSSHRV